jgi:3-phenylpropionate/trans-cinnamate dioxygenase ferredoxin subunit
MEWKKAMMDSELALGKAKSAQFGALRVALCRLEDGVFAIEDVCTHDGGALDQGELMEGGRIECPRHGALFDVRTGKVLSLPAVKDVRRFNTKVENGEIYVEL